MNSKEKDIKKPDANEIEKYSSNYTEKGFWSKIKHFPRWAGRKVLYYALTLHYTLQSPAISSKDKVLIYGALAYFILPTDLVSDFLPVVGFTDDMAALALAASRVIRNITPDIKAKARHKLNKWWGDNNTQSNDSYLPDSEDI